MTYLVLLIHDLAVAVKAVVTEGFRKDGCH